MKHAAHMLAYLPQLQREAWQRDPDALLGLLLQAHGLLSHVHGLLSHVHGLLGQVETISKPAIEQVMQVSQSDKSLPLLVGLLVLFAVGQGVLIWKLLTKPAAVAQNDDGMDEMREKLIRLEERLQYHEKTLDRLAK